MRVMLVDDEPRFRDLLAEYLGAKGFDVMPVPSGEKALERVGEFRPHLVLLDLLMPGIGGMETLRRLRAGYPGSQVIMVTAIEDLDTARKALAAGAVDYLTKPFSLDYLDSVLAIHAPQPKDRASDSALADSGMGDGMDLLDRPTLVDGAVLGPQR
jgi:DNA-binding response OmpR family regulator